MVVTSFSSDKRYILGYVINCYILISLKCHSFDGRHFLSLIYDSYLGLAYSAGYAGLSYRRHCFVQSLLLSLSRKFFSGIVSTSSVCFLDVEFSAFFFLATFFSPFILNRS